ncbi:hypothetical protein L209DRAFT_122373 [Thermothelomyces heterothallicus CBS 203.75]
MPDGSDGNRSCLIAGIVRNLARPKKKEKETPDRFTVSWPAWCRAEYEALAKPAGKWPQPRVSPGILAPPESLRGAVDRFAKIASSKASQIALIYFSPWSGEKLAEGTGNRRECDSSRENERKSGSLIARRALDWKGPGQPSGVKRAGPGRGTARWSPVGDWTGGKGVCQETRAARKLVDQALGWGSQMNRNGEAEYIVKFLACSCLPSLQTRVEGTAGREGVLPRCRRVGKQAGNSKRPGEQSTLLNGRSRASPLPLANPHRRFEKNLLQGAVWKGARGSIPTNAVPRPDSVLNLDRGAPGAAQTTSRTVQIKPLKTGRSETLVNPGYNSISQTFGSGQERL